LRHELPAQFIQRFGCLGLLNAVFAGNIGLQGSGLYQANQVAHDAAAAFDEDIEYVGCNDCLRL